MSMTETGKKLTGILLAAVLSVSGTLGTWAQTAQIGETEKGMDEGSISVSQGLIDELLGAGPYASGEVILTVNEAFTDDWSGDFVYLAEVDRRHILQAVSEDSADRQEDTGLEYEAFVRDRLEEEKNRSQDSFQILLIQDPEKTTGDLLGMFYADPQVIMAEPNYYANTVVEDQDGKQAAKTESEAQAAASGSAFDLSFLQWYAQSSEPSVYATPSAPLHAGYSLNVPDWNTDQENASGTICVMDSGIDTTHPDLESVLYTFTKEQQEKYDCGPHGVNVNTRSLSDEMPAESEETYRKDISDHLMHGTHIAGMIGAAWDRKGVSGIANGIRLLAVRLNENDGRGQGASDVLKGFEWLCRVAEEVNLKAVNVSLGSMQPQLIHTVMANKLGELGVNTVYASGNGAMNLDETIDMGGQNNSPYVIVVNAADMDGKKTQFSCYGLMSTDVFAPGAQILSTVPGIVESRNAEGNLLRIENRRRLFPEAMEIMNPSGTAIERFDQEQTQVRFFDQCPVGQDGQPNPDAEEIGAVSSQAGYDDDSCWAVPASMLREHQPEEETIWMPDMNSAKNTLWIAIPVEQGKTVSQAAVKACLSDDSHIMAGLTGVLCERKDADGTLHPAPVDLRYDNVLSSGEIADQGLAPGIGITMAVGMSSAQWSELNVDLDQFVKEIAYYHSIAAEEAADSEVDDLEHPADPGEIDGIYEWEDGGQKYLLLEFGIAYSDAPGAKSSYGSMELYFDNIATAPDETYTGAYESICGTSMAAPCVTASLGIIAKGEPETADMTVEERKQAALERKAKLLAAVDYDEDLSKLCSTGGRVNLHGQTEFTKKAPIIIDAAADRSALEVNGYFFGDSGRLYIDGEEVPAAEWSDQRIAADTGLLPNGVHELKIVNADEAVSKSLFSASMIDEGRRLYEQSWPLPLEDDLFVQDQADGIYGMAVQDDGLYAMAAYGLDQAQALWRLDLNKRTWSRCADLPDTVQGRSMENCGLVPWQGKLYCYTCRNGLNNEKPTLWAYDPETDTWEEFLSGQIIKNGQLFALEEGLFLVTDASLPDQEKDSAAQSGTEADDSEQSETEADGSVQSETEAFFSPVTSFYRIDLEKETLVQVSGSLPMPENIYSCLVASSPHAMYLLGIVDTDEGEEERRLFRMVWNAQKDAFVTEDLSEALSAVGKVDLHNAAMKGYGAGAALVFTTDAGQDTFLLEDGMSQFRMLDQVSCYSRAFKPTLAYGGGWLYALALNATEPEVAYLRSTKID